MSTKPELRRRVETHGIVVGVVVPRPIPHAQPCQHCGASTSFGSPDIAVVPEAARLCTDCALPYLVQSPSDA